MIMVVYFYIIGVLLMIGSLGVNKLFVKNNNIPGEKRASWFKILFDILVAWYVAANSTLVLKILYKGLYGLDMFNERYSGGTVIFERGMLHWIMVITILIDAFVIPVFIYKRICGNED